METKKYQKDNDWHIIVYNTDFGVFHFKHWIPVLEILCFLPLLLQSEGWIIPEI